jgi:hypothetical protein
MPMVVTSPNAPYDSMQFVLRIARTRLLDAIQTIGGDVLTDAQPFSQYIANAAWRRLQEFLAVRGFARLKSEAVLYQVPSVAPNPPYTAPDPAMNVWINWDQCFDGQNYFNAPTLPKEMISPFRVWERPTAFAPKTPGKFLEMDQMLSGLPAVPHGWRSLRWQWRDDALYIQGATQATDLWIFFAAYLPDFIDMGTVPWSQAKVPIPRAADALAWYIVYETSMARGDLESSTINQMAEDAATRLTERETMEPRSVGNASEFFKMPDSYTPSGQSAPSVKGG